MYLTDFFYLKYFYKIIYFIIKKLKYNLFLYIWINILNKTYGQT
jgi:hypothetical protein